MIYISINVAVYTHNYTYCLFLIHVSVTLFLCISRCAHIAIEMIKGDTITDVDTFSATIHHIEQLVPHGTALHTDCIDVHRYNGYKYE